MEFLTNNRPLLIIHSIDIDQYESSRFSSLIERVTEKVSVKYSNHIKHMMKICSNQRELAGVVVNWQESFDTLDNIKLILTVNKKFPDLPIFLVSEDVLAEDVNTDLLKCIHGYYFLDDDTLTFMSGRILHSVQEYVTSNYPPFFKALVKYVHEYKYAWHIPGHMGGEGFLKGPAGAALYDFFGENTLRSDLSISVPELGSLLDHSGVVREAEDLAAKTFNADRSYFVLNGTSTVNQIIWRSQVTNDDVALVDRNCHKSLNYAMVITGAKPIYMIPRRNGIGIIGPVSLSEMMKKAINEKKTIRR